MKKILCHFQSLFFPLSVFFSGWFFSCNSDDISEKSIYTFVGETAYSYCRDRGAFSIFAKLMEDTKTNDLLSCYGHYTCFIPADTAFQRYFEGNSITYDSLTTLQKRNILYNHIVSSSSLVYDSESFEVGALPSYNMNDNSLVVSFSYQGDTAIYISECPVVSKDYEVHNGIIHVIGKVIIESENYLLDVLKEDSSFMLFSEALEKTHLGDSTHLKMDMNYVYTPDSNLPKFRKFGYTIFAEPDAVFQDRNINTLSDLITYAEQYYGTEDRNLFTSRKNALNKFISYHILDRSMSTNEMTYHGACTVADYEDQQFEYYETFLKYRLMEIKSGNKINLQKSGSYVAIEESKSNKQGINGYVHTLKNILVYDENVMQNDVLNKRIRFDVYVLAPELTNSNIRWTNGFVYRLPDGYCGNRIKFSTGYGLLGANESWTNFQSTQIWLQEAYDVTFVLLPIPPGTYEIRYGYTAWYDRGINQMYFDNKVVGIPIDMSRFGGEETGWVLDSETEDGGISTDKVMRNLGYMKAPSSMTANGVAGSFRDLPQCQRIIMGTYIFQEYGYHTIRMRNVESPELRGVIDYIEYVPKSYLQQEGKD